MKRLYQNYSLLELKKNSEQIYQMGSINSQVGGQRNVPAIDGNG